MEQTDQQKQRRRVENLIKRLTNANADELDAKLLKQFRLSVGDMIADVSLSADAAVGFLFRTLMQRLANSNSAVRLLAVQLLKWVFPRSCTIRHLLLVDLCRFMQLTCGINSHPLPPIPDPRLALRLKADASRLIRQWRTEYYGDDSNHAQCNGVYFRLYLAEQYLKSLNPIAAGNAELTATGNTQQQLAAVSLSLLSTQLRLDERQRRAMQANLVVYRRMLLLEWPKQESMIQENLIALRNILDILVPADIIAGQQPLTGLGGGNARDDKLSISARPAVLETEDNSLIFDALREAIRLGSGKHLQWIDKLIRLHSSVGQILTQSTSEEDHGITVALKQCQLFRLELQSLLEMCRELGVEAEERLEEARMWEIPLILEPPEPFKGPSPVALTDAVIDEPLFVPEHDDIGNTLQQQQQQPIDDENETFEDLLRRAPVIEYGEDLYYWDKTTVPFNQSGIEFHHRFMGDGSGENTLSSRTLDRLRKRVVNYQPPPQIFASSRSSSMSDSFAPNAAHTAATANVTTAPAAAVHPELNSINAANRSRPTKSTILGRLKRQQRRR